MSTTDTADDGHRSFWETYYGEAVAELAQQYPGDKRHLTIEWGDLLRYDVDLAEDYLVAPDTIDQMLRNALEDMPIPAGRADGDAAGPAWRTPKRLDRRRRARRPRVVGR